MAMSNSCALIQRFRSLTSLVWRKEKGSASKTLNESMSGHSDKSSQLRRRPSNVMLEVGHSRRDSRMTGVLITVSPMRPAMTRRILRGDRSHTTGEAARSRWMVLSNLYTSLLAKGRVSYCHL